MKRNSSLIAIVLILALAALVGGAWSGVRQGGGLPFVARIFADDTRSGGARNVQSIVGDYREALELVTANHVGEIDLARTNEMAMQAALSALDPHSMFINRDEFRRFLEEQRSSFYGIGVQILRHRDGVYVQSVVQGTPAARAGVRYGDRIVEVDGQNTIDWTVQQVSQRVRGVRGTSVILKIERAGEAAPTYLTIVRDAVPLPSIRDAFMLPSGVGYISLTGGFTETTDSELTDALARLRREGMRALVLDLRNNPGGYLEKAVRVAGHFLPPDKTIVSVRSRDETQARVYRNPISEAETVPLVVLINRGSASASEIVAGAIQDHARGLIVGETSFGKGLVQRVFDDIPFGNAITLTIAKYYTPYGRSIQRDYSSGSLYDYYTRHAVRTNEQPPIDNSRATSAPTLPASPMGAPTVTIPTPTPSGSPVTTAAGRVFYDGHGITPDIQSAPLDLTSPVRGRIFDAAFYFTRDLAAGRIAGFENYRVERTQYDRQARPSDYPVTDALLEAFREYVRAHAENRLTTAQIDAEIDFTRLRIRDEIVTAAFGNTAAGRVLLENDPQLLRAIEVLPDARRLAESGAIQS
jgi:carboxyl-terminal processing protease